MRRISCETHPCRGCHLIVRQSPGSDGAVVVLVGLPVDGRRGDVMSDGCAPIGYRL